MPSPLQGLIDTRIISSDNFVNTSANGIIPLRTIPSLNVPLSYWPFLTETLDNWSEGQKPIMTSNFL